MAKLIAVAILIAILLGSQTGEAGCAWVLWDRLRVWDREKGGSTGWQIVEAAESRDQCLATLRTAIAGHVARGARRGGPVGDVQYDDPEYKISHTYSCLPDTIDPREPKGAAR